MVRPGIFDGAHRCPSDDESDAPMTPRLERTNVSQQELDGAIDGIVWEELELPLECGIENPDECDACQ